MTPLQGDTLDFLIELSRSLHVYGASADRLEAAVSAVSLSLGMNAAVFSTPTMLTLVFQFPDESGKRAEITRLLRVFPHSIDLDKLTSTDKLGDLVMSRKMSPFEGLESLKALQTRKQLFPTWLRIVSYGCSSLGVCSFFAVTTVDLAVAFFVGLAVGCICERTRLSPNASSLTESIAAFVAAVMVKFLALLIPHLSTETVILSGLAVLFPGLMMTVALRELSTQNLASGVARMAGALMTLLKLIVGVALGSQLVPGRSLGYVLVVADHALPHWISWPILPLTTLAFAILFRAPLKKTPLILIAVLTGLGAAKLGTAWVGPNFGVFFAGCGVGVVSNFFARVFKRPASITLVPGVIMLVPGSLSYRSLIEFWSADPVTGLQSGITAIFFATALAAGILFGNLLLPPRRIL